MQRTAAETRSHLLAVAGELFYWKGIRATGVDQVAAEAGVAPTTLYRLFGSKDDLVGAYVDHSSQDLRGMFEAAIEVARPDPRSQLLAIVDAVSGLVSSDQFRGCGLMMALAEFPDKDLPAHRNAVEGKKWARQRIGTLTDQLGVSDAIGLADQIVLVLEGMLAAAQAHGVDGPARQGRRLAELILSSAPRQPALRASTRTPRNRSRSRA